MNTKTQHILVLGLGVSGRSAVRLMLQEGSSVVVVDAATPSVSQGLDEMLCSGARVVSDIESVIHEDFSLCIVSPGISVDHPWMLAVRMRGIPVLPEFEVGWFRTANRTLAVTGSNGKSTVTKWLAESLQDVGISAVPCGNYGLPVCEIVGSGTEPDVLVMELSSFQLETSQQFRPDAALLLNVLPNHLDRHASIEAYRQIKLRIFEHLSPSKPAIIPDDLFAYASKLFPDRNWITFGITPHADFRYADEKIYHQGRLIADLSGTCYGNDVMGCSAAGVFALLAQEKVSAEKALHALRRMEHLPHRQQVVANLNGIRFINDSKATNLAALLAAVKSCRSPVRLIAGGQAKEKEFNSVKEILAQRVKSIYLIGKDAARMAADWEQSIPCVICETLENAVQKAWGDALDGETVLLSPGCTSYDQFRNFEERGETFAVLVNNLNIKA